MAEFWNVQDNSLISCGGIQGHSFHTTLKIIPLKGYDVILGMDWLEEHSPMEIHWADKWLQFSHCNQLIRLQGILPTTSLGTLVSQHQLQALDKTDSILYVVQLQTVDTTTNSPQDISSLPSELQDILSQFNTVFSPPTELPPLRSRGHKIPLLEGA